MERRARAAFSSPDTQHMKAKASGFILILALLMIALMALFMLLSLQSLVLYSKITGKQVVNHQNFYALETMAMGLAAKQSHQMEKHCLFTLDEAHEIISRLKRGEGCRLNDPQRIFVYLVEDLGQDECLMVRQNGQVFASHHWRYSIASMEEEKLQTVLQIRVIEAEKGEKCQKQTKLIRAGISSWRYLSLS